MKNLIAMDFAKQYPVTSKRGHKYIFIMYNSNSNYTFEVPVKYRKTSEYLRAFQECYNKLKQHGFTAHLLQLDNEISKDLINCICDNELDFQIVSPGNHQLNPAEQAIQTFKSYFKSARVPCQWMGFTHSPNATDIQFDPAVLHQPCNICLQPNSCIFNFNATPLLIPGINVCVHN